MKVVIQRVSSASVVVDEQNYKAEIDKGLMILVGIVDDDSDDDIQWLVNKILGLRIFDDSNGVMNLSVKDICGDVMAVSQFTLYASTKKGNRPSYIRAAKPDISVPLYEKFCIALQDGLGKEVKRGIFGADMKVSLVNDGPVTIVIDTKNKE